VGEGICEAIKNACVETAPPFRTGTLTDWLSLCHRLYNRLIKVVPGIRTYVAIDGGMSDNPRPITYQSVYRALVANKMSAPLTQTVTIAGKHCESGDILIKETHPKPSQEISHSNGNWCYNYSMALTTIACPDPQL